MVFRYHSPHFNCCLILWLRIEACAGHWQRCCQVFVRCLGYLPAGASLFLLLCLLSLVFFTLTFHQKLIQRMISTRGILRSVFACDNVAPFVLFIPSENANPSHSILIWVSRGSICLISLLLPASACFCMRCFVAFNSVFTIIRLNPFFVLYVGQSFLPKSTGIHKARRSCNGPFGIQVNFGSFQRRHYLIFFM